MGIYGLPHLFTTNLQADRRCVKTRMPQELLDAHQIGPSALQ